MGEKCCQVSSPPPPPPPPGVHVVKERILDPSPFKSPPPSKCYSPLHCMGEKFLDSTIYVQQPLPIITCSRIAEFRTNRAIGQNIPYAPVNVKPHYPHVGHIGGNVGICTSGLSNPHPLGRFGINNPRLIDK